MGGKKAKSGCSSAQTPETHFLANRPLTRRLGRIAEGESGLSMISDLSDSDEDHVRTTLLQTVNKPSLCLISVSSFSCENLTMYTVTSTRCKVKFGSYPKIQKMLMTWLTCVEAVGLQAKEVKLHTMQYKKGKTVPPQLGYVPNCVWTLLQQRR